jgi:hypothetical protein
MHPLLRLIISRPLLLAQHAEAYGELVAAEFGAVSAAWKRRALLNAVAVCCLGVAAVLGGVSLMLWAVVPAPQIHAEWALLAAPLIPVALAAGCMLAARERGAASGASFDRIREQLKADLAMLQAAGDP